MAQTIDHTKLHFFLLNIAVKYGYVDIVREMIQYYDNITLSIIIWLNNSIVTVFSVLFSIFSELHSNNRINLFCSEKNGPFSYSFSQLSLPDFFPFLLFSSFIHLSVLLLCVPTIF